MTAVIQTDGVDGPYWNALAEGQVKLPRCAACGEWHWPAVSRCGSCGAWSIEWWPVELEGVIYSWTRTWHKFAGTEGLTAPFVTVLVALPRAGERRLLGVLEGEQAGLAIGAAVHGEISQTAFGAGFVPALRWRLAV